MTENISLWLRTYRYAIMVMAGVTILLASSFLFLSRDMAPQLHAPPGSNSNVDSQRHGIANVFTPIPGKPPTPIPGNLSTPIPGKLPTPIPGKPPTPNPGKPPITTPGNQPPPANTPTPLPGGNLIQDGSFETDSSLWVYGGTTPPARTTAQANTGTYSLKLGYGSGQQGDAIAYQLVTIPTSANTATLSFSYWPASNDSSTYAWQEADIIDSNGAVIQRLFVDTANDNAWIRLSFNLSSYAGQTIGIQFLDHENSNGYSYYTYMYVDDVSLNVS